MTRVEGRIKRNVSGGTGEGIDRDDMMYESRTRSRKGGALPGSEKEET